MRAVRLSFLLLAAAFSLAMPTPARAQTARIDVWIETVTTLVVGVVGGDSADACGRQDYFAKVRVGTVTRTTPVVNNRDNPSPFWLTSFLVPRPTGAAAAFTIPARIELWEDDDFFCGGGDDHIDITPGRGKSLVGSITVRTDGSCDAFGFPCGTLMSTAGRTYGLGTSARVNFRVYSTAF